MVVLVGPSGTGKSTLAGRLLAEFTDLELSISHTTRAPRGAERDGREYHFVDRERFEDMIARDAFLEWARVHDNYYGTSRENLEVARARSRGILFDIDYQGARQLRARAGRTLGVFVLPPTMAELERRLRARGTESEEKIRLRLANARRELESYPMFDHLVVNDDLERAFRDLRAIVLADRTRTASLARRAEELLAER